MTASPRKYLDTVLRPLVAKWVEPFGLAHYSYTVRPLPKDCTDRVWARSIYNHEDEWFVVEFGPHEHPPNVAETLVLHELSHGLLTYAVQMGMPGEEVVCNRLPRLLLGKRASLPNRFYLDDPTSPVWSDMPMSPFVKRLTPALVDLLPDPDREVVNALYWEGVSVREVGRRLGVHHEQVRRIRDRAFATLRDAVEAVEE